MKSCVILTLFWLFSIVLIFNSLFADFTGPTNIGTGVVHSSIAFGDIDNDGDLDLIVSGMDSSGNHRLDKYINTNSTKNNPPNAPTIINAIDSGGYWRFYWASASDDHTLPILMRYKIAISTNSSGTYDYVSDIIDYPRGQANIGNIPQGWISSNECFYQSKIPVTKTVYWKVAAIDTSFKFTYSSESIASLTPSSPPEPENLSPNVRIIDNVIYLHKNTKCKVIFVVDKPTTVEMRIYDITAKLVKEIKQDTVSIGTENEIFWDGRDERGKRVGYGVYLLYFKAGELELKEKVVVLK